MDLPITEETLLYSRTLSAETVRPSFGRNPFCGARGWSGCINSEEDVATHSSRKGLLHAWSAAFHLSRQQKIIAHWTGILSLLCTLHGDSILTLAIQ
jgi:hypothetical protein